VLGALSLCKAARVWSWPLIFI